MIVKDVWLYVESVGKLMQQVNCFETMFLSNTYLLGYTRTKFVAYHIVFDCE